MTRLAAIWPALLFLLVALTGGVESGARLPLAALGAVALAGTAIFGAPALADPLALGRGARLLPPALLVTVVASLAVAETPRAGVVGVALLPLLLLVPAAVARAFGHDLRRALAIAAWGVAVVVLSLWALLARLVEGERFAGAPLGDRELLALIVAAALPVAALGWRAPGASRWIAAAAVACGVAALVAARSLAGAAALAVACAFAARRVVRGRELLAGAVLLSAALLVPPLAAALAGDDVAGRERWALVRADWRAALERPWLGWGPGAAAWTEAAIRPPLPNDEPPTLGLGSPRPLPLVAAFELGLPALALAAATAVAFGLARGRRRATAPDAALATAGAASLLAGGVGLLAGAWHSAPALPATLAIAVGLLLAGEGAPRSTRGRRAAYGATLVYAGLAVGLAWPFAAAAVAYEQARRADDASLRAERLAAAVRLDPRFPLYRARASWNDEAGGWRQALAAARAARGVGPLWLRAATLANAAGERRVARLAAAQALALEPLTAPPAFLLHALDPTDVDCAARAMLAEPRLAAAARWRGREASRRRALERVREWPGIDARWRRDFYRLALASPPGEGRDQDLVVSLDARPATSVSLRIFRRPAWRAEILRMRIDRAAARRLAVRPAITLQSSSPEAFPTRRCAPD